jgi:hypothetical protein
MLNNEPLIRPLLQFGDPDHFYWVQIIRRRKENPEMSSGTHILDNMYIQSSESWERKQDTMRRTAEAHRARVYINLNRRSFKRVALKALELMAGAIANEQYHAVKNHYPSACGTVNAEPGVSKTWIADIDTQDTQPEITFAVYTTIYQKIPTLNGYHLVVKPFDLRPLQGAYDIKRDNPTLLYAPC